MGVKTLPLGAVHDETPACCPPLPRVGTLGCWGVTIHRIPLQEEPEGFLHLACERVETPGGHVPPTSDLLSSADVTTPWQMLGGCKGERGRASSLQPHPLPPLRSP